LPNTSSTLHPKLVITPGAKLAYHTIGTKQFADNGGKIGGLGSNNPAAFITKVYAGFGHGMAMTSPEVINRDLLEFFSKLDTVYQMFFGRHGLHAVWDILLLISLCLGSNYVVSRLHFTLSRPPATGAQSVAELPPAVEPPSISHSSLN